MKIKPVKGDFRLSLGERGEMVAAAYLVEKGYRVLGKKLRAPFGELDLVARHKDTLVFIEVKTRSSGQSGLPEEAVDLSKQKQIIRLAEWYCQRENIRNMKIRLDVLAIDYDGQAEPKIRHVLDAFRVE